MQQNKIQIAEQNNHDELGRATNFTPANSLASLL
jgi:hypothetical protein